MKNKTIVIAGLLIIVMLAVLLIAGCGSKAQDPQESLNQAVQSAREAESVKAQINVTVSPQAGTTGMGVDVQGDAGLDMKAKTMEASLSAMGISLDLRYVNSSGYLKFGSTWYELTGELVPGIGKDTLDGFVNLLAGYPDLFSNVAEITKAGDKKVGNYDCTNYDVTPDLNALAANASIRQLAEQLGMESGSLADTLQQAGLEMQIAIQKSEPIIREVFIAANADMPQGGKIMGIPLLPAKAHIETVIDFPEYGIAVKVEAPQGAKPFTGIGDLLGL
ncbi:MAG: hypothetical protein A2W01_04875 [Candidatus Solincola sediminis]|uniref:Uncharacterized protein n=1 Tax=Candidatus Solincola sediminis TaxID=1797199 RepID=A0A1F2WFC2_9ACTN|nr:MAG: hypothetical protein A2Y75_09610 [Candidatus Solincola sediminis]OFW57760.1 MAG: hypothetical protein A2W01_04875 [Candidatus Solincola sediminis]